MCSPISKCALLKTPLPRNKQFSSDVFKRGIAPFGRIMPCRLKNGAVEEVPTLRFLMQELNSTTWRWEEVDDGIPKPRNQATVCVFRIRGTYLAHTDNTISHVDEGTALVAEATPRPPDDLSIT